MRRQRPERCCCCGRRRSRHGRHLLVHLLRCRPWQRRLLLLPLRQRRQMADCGRRRQRLWRTAEREWWQLHLRVVISKDALTASVLLH